MSQDQVEIFGVTKFPIKLRTDPPILFVRVDGVAKAPRKTTPAFS